MNLLFSGVAGFALTLTVPADAAVTLTAAPASGVNMSNIHVGDTFNIEFYLGGTEGEHYLGGGSQGMGYTTNLSYKFLSFGPDIHADVSTNPLFYTWNYTAISAGPALIYGFLDKTGFSSGPITFDSNEIYFTVHPGVPEPATWALMILGFGAIGGMMRRRTTAKASVQFA